VYHDNSSFIIFNMVQVTNVVVHAALQVTVDLKQVANSTRDVRYDPTLFSAVIWQHRKIGGNCLVFKNGKVNCSGSKSVQQAKKRLRQYARLIQKLGYNVMLGKIDLVTMSAVHQLSSRLNFQKMCEDLGAMYQPEIHNAAMLKLGNLHFMCFHTGKVVITGIKNLDVIYPILLELELCTLLPISFQENTVHLC